MKPTAKLHNFLLGSSLLALLGSSAAFAAGPYYWDNLAGAGFGSAGGTWSATTAGPIPGWNTDSTGALAPSSVTTGTGDALNFGSATDNLGAGTITVGTVSSGDMTFATGSGAIVLSGGTITLAATQTTTVNNTSDTIGSILAGAATSFTKAGNGTLTLSGANTYVGATAVSTGTLILQGVAFSTKARNYSVATNAVLNLDNAGGIASGTSNITGAGTLRISGGLLAFGSSGSHAVVINLSGGGLIDITSTGSTAAYFQNVKWTGNQGSLQLNGSVEVWDGNPVTVDALTGSGTFNKGTAGTTGGAAIFTVGTAGGGGIFSGAITNTAGSLALTKTGTGTQTLSGTNSYSGTTTVSGGTLQFAKQASLYNNTPASWTAAKINVKSGATLALNVDSAGTAGFTSTSLNTLLTNISFASSATAGLQSGAKLGFDKHRHRRHLHPGQCHRQLHGSQRRSDRRDQTRHRHPGLRQDEHLHRRNQCERGHACHQRQHFYQHHHRE